MKTWSYTDECADDLLPKRDPNGNKGTFGKVSIVAGSCGMAGASLLAARACYRSGAGMVRIVTTDSNRIIAQLGVPEALLTGYADDAPSDEIREKLTSAFSWSDVAVIGPGLSRSETAKNLVIEALELAPRYLRGLVIDADAIWIIATQQVRAATPVVLQSEVNRPLKEALREAAKQIPIVLTPHMRECSTLLGLPMEELQADVPAAIKRFADEYHCTILCKDAKSYAATWDSDLIYRNESGNDGLATAGSGDVLAGMTGAILAQMIKAEAGTASEETDATGVSDTKMAACYADCNESYNAGYRAVCAAAWLHGKAAQLLTKDGSTRALMAGDLPDVLGKL